jgi:hypothetical protein
MASAADRAVEVFDRPIRATDLLSMDNPASSIRLELAVRPLDESGRPRVSNVAGTGPLPAYRILGEDAERTDWNSMIMEVSADRDVYVAILRIDPTGDLQVLFPNPVTRVVGFYPKGLIRANETVRIPSSLADDSNIAGFYLNAEPPLGRYELRAFAAADLKTAIRIWEYIGEYGIAQQELERDALYREEQRRQAAARHEGELASRGGAITPIGADWKPDWTAVTVSYVVED